MLENTDNNVHVPPEGFMYRSKNNPSDFSVWLRIGTGASIDDYDTVPVAVYEQYLAEQEEKMKMETALFYDDYTINN